MKEKCDRRKLFFFFKEKDPNIFVGKVSFTVERAGVSESGLNLNSGPVPYCNCRKFT